MAMEKMLAPRVVRPPWANKMAWNRSTTAPMGAMAAGPNSTAPRPVPVGWEQLPVTEGSFRAERTNVNAAATPSSMRCSGFSFIRLLTVCSP